MDRASTASTSRAATPVQPTSRARRAQAAAITRAQADPQQADPEQEPEGGHLGSTLASAGGSWLAACCGARVIAMERRA